MGQARWGVFLIALLAVSILRPPSPIAAADLRQPPDPATHLSPYWSYAVLRWEDLILKEAQRRGLDPDLIAAVIWKESLGHPYARGPAGAVGLMMVMPREAGFSWRPLTEDLENPHRNVFWGTRALATTIDQSGGDLYSALAAYNGGWDQIHLSGPRGYAEAVMASYARAVAVRHGLPPEGHWVATVTTTDEHNTLTVLGPQRPLARYTRRPIMADLPSVSIDGAPTAIVSYPAVDDDFSSRVGIWIVLDHQVVGQEREASPQWTSTSSRGYGTRLFPLSSRLLPAW